MSKRDIFEHNIKSLTQARNLASAVKGWEIANAIAIDKKDSAATCELCGTRFRNGALIRRPGSRSKKATTVTVGGTCLETILRGSFGDSPFIAKRKSEISSRLRSTYGDLVEDPGHWIKWLVEHVPTRLRALAAQLRYLGMVPTDRELNRLIAFHDAHRKYLSEALLPSLIHWANDIPMPNHLTIVEARALLKSITLNQWEKILAQRSDTFRDQEIAPFLAMDPEWHEAWRRLGELHRHTVITLARLSTDLSDDQMRRRNVLTHRVSPIRPPYAIPCFVWVEGRGLAIVTELSDDSDEEATAWLWYADEYRAVTLDTCRSVAHASENVGFDLTVLAFLDQPRWYKGRILVHAAPPTTAHGRRHNTEKRVKSLDEWYELSQIACIAKMLAIASFKGQTDLVGQFTWLKNRVEEMGQEWSDFKWKAERYSTNPDCRAQMDRIMRRLAK